MGPAKGARRTPQDNSAAVTEGGWPAWVDAAAVERLQEAIRGESIGHALWKARRHFLSRERRNPLGLAYTLYGRGVATLGDRPLISSPRPIR